MKQVVTIGGATGHSQVLKALNGIEDIQITGICPSTDSGGSTGVLEREYRGAGYTGDLTKCIVALTDDATLGEALMYRYEGGPLDGHSVKNLLFHALQKVSTVEEALAVLGRVCGLGRHRIFPVTQEKTELCASLAMGNTIVGETNIDTIAKNPLWNPDAHSIKDIYLKPEVAASPAVLEAIRTAEHIVICPGDLYSSVIPTLLPQGMKGAIAASSAPIILILNIMTKTGETDNYTAMDFVKKIESHLGREAAYILYNDAPIPEDVLLTYSLVRKVELGDFENVYDARLVPVPMATVSETGYIYSDPLAMRTAIKKLIAA